MFGIGFFEIVIIGVAMLLFVGPQKLPDVMRQAGKLFVQLRRTANDVRSTFEQVIHDAEQELRRDEIEKMKIALSAKTALDPKTLLGQVTGITDTTPKPSEHPAAPQNSMAQTSAAPTVTAAPDEEKKST